MKTSRQFFEDIGERRALLKQRQRDQVSAFKERGAQRAQSAMQTSSDFRQKSHCLLYTSPSPRDLSTSRMPSSA